MCTSVIKMQITSCKPHIFNRGKINSFIFINAYWLKNNHFIRGSKLIVARHGRIRHLELAPNT